MGTEVHILAPVNPKPRSTKAPLVTAKLSTDTQAAQIIVCYSSYSSFCYSWEDESFFGRETQVGSYERQMRTLGY